MGKNFELDGAYIIQIYRIQLLIAGNLLKF